MAFLRFFDLVEFDKTGQVCETKTCDLETARANYLYLLSKYNQKFLKEQSMAVPEFFKRDLNAILESVKAGGDFSSAKAKVLANCLPAVQTMASNSKTDRELVEKLNEKTNVYSDAFAKIQSKLVNSKILTYVLAKTAGDLEVIIEKNKYDQSAEAKSKTFKKMIEYNALIGTAERVESNQLTVEDFVKQAG